MIDMSTYNTLHQNQNQEAVIAPHDMALSLQAGIGHDAMKAKEPPGEKFLLTLPTKVPGFGFHNKRWGMFMYPIGTQCLH